MADIVAVGFRLGAVVSNAVQPPRRPAGYQFFFGMGAKLKYRSRPVWSYAASSRAP